MRSQLSTRAIIRFATTLLLLSVLLLGSPGCESASDPCDGLDPTQPERTACLFVQTVQELTAQGKSADEILRSILDRVQDDREEIWVGDRRYEDYFLSNDYGHLRNQFENDLLSTVYTPTADFSAFTTPTMVHPRPMTGTKVIGSVRYITGDVELVNGTGFSIYRMVEIEERWYLYSLGFTNYM
jgi:hypothetical protein